MLRGFLPATVVRVVLVHWILHMAEYLVISRAEYYPSEVVAHLLLSSINVQAHHGRAPSTVNAVAEVVHVPEVALCKQDVMAP